MSSTGELIDTETVPISSEGGGGKRTPPVIRKDIRTPASADTSPAAYPTPVRICGSSGGVIPPERPGPITWVPPGAFYRTGENAEASSRFLMDTGSDMVRRVDYRTSRSGGASSSFDRHDRGRDRRPITMERSPDQPVGITMIWVVLHLVGQFSGLKWKKGKTLRLGTLEGIDVASGHA